MFQIIVVRIIKNIFYLLTVLIMKIYDDLEPKRLDGFF